MAAKQKSLYLTDGTLAAVRPGDSLSGRVNQIIDRYREIIRIDRLTVRQLFTDASWKRLVEVSTALEDDTAVAIPAALARAVEAWPKLAEQVAELSAGDLFVLIELLEAERIANGTKGASAPG